MPRGTSPSGKLWLIPCWMEELWLYISPTCCDFWTWC